MVFTSYSGAFEIIESATKVTPSLGRLAGRDVGPSGGGM